jgi:hypothetical protein
VETVSAALAALLAAAGPASPEASSQGGGRIGNATDYELLYGQPVYWSLTFLVSPTNRDMPPKGKAIRTRGVLAIIPRPRDKPDVKLCVAETLDCLRLETPVPELRDRFFEDVKVWSDYDTQIVGAFTEEGFLFWSYDGAPRRKRAASGSERSLEALVVQADRNVGREVVVRGRFGGGNLFGDFPPETRRSRTDWVLRDPPFALWITGAEPRGKGWRLDTTARSECTWRLQVAGLLERHDGVLYLKARDVQLLGREPGATCD